MKKQHNFKNGIRIYPKLLLPAYDQVALKWFGKFIWRCEAGHYVELYNNNVTCNHAEIGVGTGYCLDKSQLDPSQSRIALIDLQENCLHYASSRLARFKPETYKRNAYFPIDIGTQHFDSIAICGLLHCLPGEMQDKATVFDAIQSLVKPNTKVYGYTLVNKGVRNTWRSFMMFKLLRWLKILNNENDSPSSLLQELKKRFHHCEVKVIGCLAFFIAEKPILQS